MARAHPREGNREVSGRPMPSGKETDERNDEQQPKRSKHDHFGRALKSVYDDTLREDVPDEFKDLLGKLR